LRIGEIRYQLSANPAFSAAKNFYRVTGGETLLQLTCEGVLCDMDGVLIDSTECVRRHWEEWARRHSIEMDRIMRIAHGQRPVETMQAVAPHLDVVREAEAFTALELADTEGIVALEGAREFLQSLQGARWGIVTSASRDLALARLAAAGLPVPPVLVSGDDVARGKPAPDPYREGVKRLGCAAHACVAIEDAPAGIQSASAAGLHVIAVASTHPKHALDGSIIVDSLSVLKVIQNKSTASLLIVAAT